jgi:cholesterol transport system auxiliary component
VKVVALLLALLSVVAAGCSLAPTAPPVAIYDFGEGAAPAPSARVDAALALDDVAVPAWLHSPAILYRLAYRDSALLQPYSRARWAAAPPALITHRLRVALSEGVQRGVTALADGVRSDYVLRVELDNFVQIVDSPTAARGVLRARASLIDANERSLRAQRSFAIERPSPSVDAAGAVQALSAATDAFITQLVEWTAREAKAQK